MYKSKYTGQQIEDILDKVENTEEYTLPVASRSEIGGIKTGYASSVLDKNYGVATDSKGNAYVNVPWINTDTTYNVVNALADGLMPKLPQNNIMRVPTDSQIITGDGKWKAIDLSYNPIINAVSLQFNDGKYSYGLLQAAIPTATNTNAGLMSSDDKKKIDNIGTKTYIAKQGVVSITNIKGPCIISAEDDTSISSILVLSDSKRWNLNYLKFNNNYDGITFEFDDTSSTVTIRGCLEAKVYNIYNPTN